MADKSEGQQQSSANAGDGAATELFAPTAFAGAGRAGGGGAAVFRPPVPPPTETPAAESGLFDRSIAVRVPLIGHLPVANQVQILAILLLLAALAVVVMVALDVRLAAGNARQVATADATLLDATRLASAAPYALQGVDGAFKELAAARDAIAANLSALADGSAERGIEPGGAQAQTLARNALETWRGSEAAASTILAQREALIAFGALVRRINEDTPRLQQATEEISALLLQSGAGAREIAAAGQLVMLTQRLGRSANSLIAGESANAEIALTLGRDINLFRELTQVLLGGSEALRIPPARDADTRTRLQELARSYDDFQKAVGGTLGRLQAIVQAKGAELAIRRGAPALQTQLGELRQAFEAERGRRTVNFVLMGVFGALVLFFAATIAKVLLADSRRRAAEAERDRAAAVQLEEAAKAANEQGQAAILRLMNELQEVAEGNLTVQATVSEDITGAIADSINYTVEELRGLVGRINVAAEGVDNASAQAREIAVRLLAASEQQSAEIRATNEEVLKMAAQIDRASRSAGQSAQVARSSLAAAQRGQSAVADQISGMNEIRAQIQDTSKRIKRLGESSQQIGEIVELIGDITEQTNVLALNAAIQAASAGEAGRGFSVVAEEVQRLADRSAEAAKQIAALVRTIQTDTQDAVAAMEKSTQGVVEGARLSDAAGGALTDIGRVSSELAELIDRVAQETQRQAVSAGGVAQAIERILAVTEQTTVGTREAAQSIGQLATLARELRGSVARFRVE